MNTTELLEYTIRTDINRLLSKQSLCNKLPEYYNDPVESINNIIKEIISNFKQQQLIPQSFPEWSYYAIKCDDDIEIVFLE